MTIVMVMMIVMKRIEYRADDNDTIDFITNDINDNISTHNNDKYDDHGNSIIDLIRNENVNVNIDHEDDNNDDHRNNNHNIDNNHATTKMIIMMMMIRVLIAVKTKMIQIMIVSIGTIGIDDVHEKYCNNDYSDNYINIMIEQ